MQKKKELLSLEIILFIYFQNLQIGDFQIFINIIILQKASYLILNDVLYLLNLVEKLLSVKGIFIEYLNILSVF